MFKLLILFKLVVIFVNMDYVLIIHRIFTSVGQKVRFYFRFQYASSQNMNFRKKLISLKGRKNERKTAELSAHAAKLKLVLLGYSLKITRIKFSAS